MTPPGVQINFDDNDVETQAMILAYSQIRDHEEHEILIASLSVPKISL